MPIICNWPDCGNVIQSPVQVVDTCPGCGKSPFATFDPATGKPFTYTAEFLCGKKLILQKAAQD